MKASIPKLLSLKNEKILACYQPSRKPFLPIYLFAVLLLLMGVLFFPRTILLIILVLLAWIELQVRFTRYIITETRCARNYQFIARHFTDISMNKVQNTHFVQGVIGRLLGYGTLLIDSAGGDGKELIFDGFTDFEEAHEIIKNQLK